MQLTLLQMSAIVEDLASRDAALSAVIAAHPLCTIATAPRPRSNFESLVESVISQQLSVRAADTIYSRVSSLTDGRVTPEGIMQLADEALRSAGLSGAKSKSVRGLATASLSGTIDFETLHEVDDDEIISTQLNALWGIGPWTVDMFMMHQLGRLDVWPTGDLGVRRGWEKIYNLEEKIEPKALVDLGEPFRPYRSIVAWYCWRAGDVKP